MPYRHLLRGTTDPAATSTSNPYVPRPSNVYSHTTISGNARVIQGDEIHYHNHSYQTSSSQPINIVRGADQSSDSAFLEAVARSDSALLEAFVRSLSDHAGSILQSLQQQISSSVKSDYAGHVAASGAATDETLSSDFGQEDESDRSTDHDIFPIQDLRPLVEVRDVAPGTDTAVLAPSPPALISPVASTRVSPPNSERMSTNLVDDHARSSELEQIQIRARSLTEEPRAFAGQQSLGDLAGQGAHFEEVDLELATAHLGDMSLGTFPHQTMPTSVSRLSTWIAHGTPWTSHSAWQDHKAVFSHSDLRAISTEMACAAVGLPDHNQTYSTQRQLQDWMCDPWIMLSGQHNRYDIISCDCEHVYSNENGSSLLGYRSSSSTSSSSDTATGTGTSGAASWQYSRNRQSLAELAAMGGPIRSDFPRIRSNLTRRKSAP